MLICVYLDIYLNPSN